jgi:SIR2-like domain/ATPase family associated with various cellular activities (AAA)
MPVDLSTLTRDIDPERTVLMFGAGSSIPSGAPSVRQLQEHFAKTFNVSGTDYTLAEQTGIIENRIHDRARLILELKSQFKSIRPTGALLNLPLCKWKSIYTTNYDELIEDCYKRRDREVNVYTCNFDFHIRRNADSVQLFKLHGTIQKDEAFGDRSRIILTQADYDSTEKYREDLYARLRGDLVGAHLIVIGHSLADPDIRSVVDRVLRLRAMSGSATKVTLFLYTPDSGRAELFEARGLEICFGGLDDFFAGMVQHVVTSTPTPATGDPLDVVHALRTSTVDVAHALGLSPDVSAMYNGWPVSYADIRAGQTFQRNVAKAIEQQIVSGSKPIAVLLGASGVGKTSAIRQALAELSKDRFAWEHKSERPFMGDKWYEVAKILQKERKSGVLMIDEAHNELAEINNLIEDLDHENNSALQLILVSTNHQWHLRTKVAGFHRNNITYQLSSIENNEIDHLLNLIESSQTIRTLAESTFSGFSFQEKRRRLIQNCSADMFVCLKNIFSSEKLDDIILREYAELDPASQDVYRSVAAMESAGVHVHRQLVIRLLRIQAMDIDAILSRLRDIIHEKTISQREGIYAWQGRHKIIMDIIAAHKFFDTKKRFDRKRCSVTILPGGAAL